MILTIGAAPAIDKRYFQGPGVDQLLAQENVTQGATAANRVWWVLPDHLGSTRDLVTGGGTGAAVGSVLAHFQFDSFGVILDGRENVTRYQYTGREHDSNTDLNYHRARWYDPLTGKWMSEDPIGFAAGDANVTRYVGNGVLNGVDPSGLVLTEQDARSLLFKQVNWLSDKGWDLAAEVLQVFLGRKGANIWDLDYNLSHHQSKVRGDSKFLAAEQIVFSKLRKIADGLKGGYHAEFKVPDDLDVTHIEWRGFENELFYAFGGAQLGYKNVTIRFNNGDGKCDYVISGNLWLWDRYTFPYGFISNQYDEYEAAYDLEHTYGYASFRDHILFDSFSFKGKFSP